MNNREMFKEAIADAKAVKEMAIANAKAALEEAFNPQLKSMFAAKLQEMDDMDEGAEAEVEEGYDKDAVEELSNPVMRRGLKGDDKPERETEYMRSMEEGDKEEMDEEMDLDEILSELDKELDENARTDAEEEGYLDGMKDEKEDLKEDERTDAEEEGYLDGMKDEKEDEKDKDEDEEIDLEDMSEDDLKDFIEDVIADMVKAGELEAGEEMDVDDEEEVDVNVEDDVEITEEKEEIEEKQGYDARLDDAEGAKHGKKKQDMKQRRADSENMEKADGKRKFAGDSKMKEELAEAYATVKTLRSELNEINLLNSKLLYTNKIFRSKNLTESQKTKVLSAFDKAQTVKEVKLVFETISDNLATTKKSVVKENLGRASKSAGVAQKKPIMEVNSQVSRWQKLAGIK
jgi:hypothetical protein